MYEVRNSAIYPRRPTGNYTVNERSLADSTTEKQLYLPASITPSTLSTSHLSFLYSFSIHLFLVSFFPRYFRSSLFVQKKGKEEG